MLSKKNITDFYLQCFFILFVEKRQINAKFFTIIDFKHKP